MSRPARLKIAALLVCLAALPGPLTSGPARAVESDFRVTAEMLRPQGESYTATVPETLDLAERARLSVHGLTSFLNPNQNYGPYGHGFFNCQTPYMTSNLPVTKEGSGIPNWGKIGESLMMARIMSGSDENLEMDAKTLQGMIQYARPDGWPPMARILLALMALDQRHPDPELKALVDKLAESFSKKAKFDGDGAYFNLRPPTLTGMRAGVWGHGHNVFIQGVALRAMTHYARYTDDEPTLDLAAKVAHLLRRPEYWTPECAPKAVYAPDHAQFMGSTHSYAACLMGLLAYAQATHDARLKQFVREGYEYLRTFGIAAIGLFGESCTVGDMTYLAIKLSDAGVGDYWDDADRYLRNGLAEHQITDTAKLQKAVQTEPILERITPRRPESVKILEHQRVTASDQYVADPTRETEDQVVERCAGVFLTDMAWPTEIPKSRLLWVICCTGNCTSALYYAWESIVRCEAGNAQVNLLLNRASPWLDLDSYLPYEGKVVIRNKSARNLSVRIPRWVDRKAIKATKDGSALPLQWTGNYLVFTGLADQDRITIEFPMVESQEEYTLLWKNEEFWKESTNPDDVKGWKPKENPDRFTLHFKGNTVVDVSPRSPHEAYPLFDRREFLKDQAPMVKVQRFVSAAKIMW